MDQPCNKPSIRCPYHAWNYHLNGNLLGRPHFNGPGQHDRFENGGGTRLDLIPVHTALWNDCIFVNLCAEPEPLEDWLAPLLQRTQAYDFTSIRWAGKLDFTINANWKLVYENYMEGYHVFAAHPRLLKHAPMEVRWSGEWIEHVFYNDYVAPALSSGRGDILPHYPGLSDENTRRGLWFLCFPQFAAEVYADQFVVLSSYPLAADQTREELHIFLIGDAASADDYRTQRDAVFQMWHELNLEDVGLLERLQQGRSSPAYDGGRLSPHWEGPTHEFAMRLFEKITSS